MQAVADSSHECETAILYVETDLLSILLNVDSKPASLRWEDNVVACNRAARYEGVRDNLNYVTALELCPDLLVYGPEHIVRLNVAVTNANKILETYCTVIERVALDECYLKFSKRIDSNYERDTFLTEIRNIGICIKSSLNTMSYNCHVGVSTTKLLARLASEKNPNDVCCIYYPENAKNYLEYQNLRCVLPTSLVNKFNRFGINSTMDILSMSMDSLIGIVGKDNAMYLRKLCCGVDLSYVVPRDLWRLVCVEYEIREKFCILLQRLFALVEDDGRVPLALKVSVRKLDSLRNTCSKETKTAPIPYGAIKPIGRVSNETIVKLMNIVMTHFNRLVDTSRPFQLSLIGLAFVRFQEQSPRMSHLNFHVPRSVASCLLRKRELSVETQLNIKYSGSGCRDANILELPTTVFDVAEVDDLTPLQKRAKLDILIKTKKLHDEEMDLCSPSKLKVADLSLGDDINISKNPRPLLQC